MSRFRLARARLASFGSRERAFGAGNLENKPNGVAVQCKLRSPKLLTAVTFTGEGGQKMLQTCGVVIPESEERWKLLDAAAAAEPASSNSEKKFSHKFEVVSYIQSDRPEQILLPGSASRL